MQNIKLKNEMIKIAFTRTKLDEERNKKDITFTTRITNDDLIWFEHAKRLIQQPKNSTAMKQLARLAYEYVLHDKKIMQMLDTVINNYRRNQRTGVTEGEFKISNEPTNVIIDYDESDTTAMD